MSLLKTEEGKLQVIELDACGLTQEEIQSTTGVPRSCVGDFLRKESYVQWWTSYEPSEVFTGEPPRIMLLDIETAPQKGYFWSRFNITVGSNQVIEPSYMLTWAAREFEGTDVEFDSLFINQDAYWEDPKDDKRIIESMYEILDEADIIIAHNGDNFDIKKIMARGAIQGFPRRDGRPPPCAASARPGTRSREWKGSGHALARMHPRKSVAPPLPRARGTAFFSSGVRR